MNSPPPYSTHHTIENALGAALLSLVWLVPDHPLPWVAFQHELAMAVVLGVCAIVLAWQTRWRVPLSVFGGVLLLMMAVPWAQWLGGLIPKTGTAAVSCAYVGAVAVAFFVGHAARVNQHRRLIDIVFAALVMAAALNVPVQWIQWLRWFSWNPDSWTMLLVTPIHSSSRPGGMILQPNQLATLQVWGLIGLSWFRYHRMLSASLFVLLFAWIGVGIGLTESRTGLLEMGLVAGLLFFSLKDKPGRDIFATWVVATGLIIVGLWFMPELTFSIGVQPSGPSRLTAIEGSRIDAWRAFGAGILERPWFGYGLTDGAEAYLAAAHTRPDFYIGQRFVHAHNAIIDVVIWFGVPLGISLLVALGAWAAKRLIELPRRPESVFPLAVLGALGLHAMLELPHQFLFFMAPAGLFAGWLMPPPASGARVYSLPRSAWAVAGVTTLAVAAGISADYFPYRERYTEWRYENSRVGKRPDTPVNPPRILNQIYDELVLYRLPLRQGMSAGELAWVSDTAHSVNTPPALYAAAKAYALAGDSETARMWMQRYNAITGTEGVRVIHWIWRRDQAAYPALAAVAWPDFGGHDSLSRSAPEAKPNIGPMPLPASSPASAQ